MPSSGISSGFSFSITNFSTQIVTVQTASASALQLMAPNTTLVVTCINGTGSGSAIAAWSWNYFSAQPSGLPVSTSSVGLYTAQQNFSLQTLTWASTLAWNLNTQQVAKVTLAGTTTISNPTNMVAGGTYVLFLTQDATGSRTVTWGANYRWSGATAPTLTTTANATDIVTFVSDGSLMYGTATTNFQ